MIKGNPIKLDEIAVQPPCVSYRIPLEEIEMARQGVSAEQLTKVDDEKIIPDHFGSWGWRKKPKSA